MADAALRLAGGVLAVLVFVVVAIGGGVYRTDCISNSGQLTRTWGLEGDIPYLWTPNNSACQAHTLTRYVLGKVGVMEDVDK